MRNLLDVLIAWGPLGVFLVAVVDSAGIPLPAAVDVELLLLGAADPRGVWLAALLAVAGSAAGCMFLFFVARKGGWSYFEARTAAGRGARFRRWYERYGLLSVFVPAAVPILPLPLKVFVLCAGALGVRPIVFLAVIVVARLGRYFSLAYLGAQLGQHSLGYLHQHRWHLAGIAAGLCAALALLVWLRDRRGRG